MISSQSAHACTQIHSFTPPHPHHHHLAPALHLRCLLSQSSLSIHPCSVKQLKSITSDIRGQTAERRRVKEKQSLTFPPSFIFLFGSDFPARLITVFLFGLSLSLHVLLSFTHTLSLCWHRLWHQMQPS